MVTILNGPRFGEMDAPITACDNAIEHYEKMIDRLETDEAKLRDQLSGIALAKKDVQEKLRQWFEAKLKLAGADETTLQSLPDPQ